MAPGFINLMGMFLNTWLFLSPMVKVLVTGGAGFIGSHVADELINLGYDVVVLDDLIGGFKENVNPKARLITGSIVDSVLIQNLFDTEKFDYVFHIAAYTAEGLSHFVRKFNYENNIKNIRGHSTFRKCLLFDQESSFL